MEGPGKAILNLSEMKDESSNYAASYLVDKPGEYRLAIKYADKHIPDSPFRVWIMPEQNLAKKIVLDPLPPKQSITMNKTINMKINLNGVTLKRKTIVSKEQTNTTIEETKTTTKTTNQDNELIAKLVSPSGNESDIFLTEIDENTCILSFKCREPGPNTVS